MTEDILPPQVLALMKPEAVSPGVLALVAEDAPTPRHSVRRRRRLRARPCQPDARRLHRCGRGRAGAGRRRVRPHLGPHRRHRAGERLRPGRAGNDQGG
ncbi:MAG: hypothetical protein WDN69_31690 [Aliidongia sp.]